MNLVPVPGRYALTQIFRRPLGAAQTNRDEWLRKRRHRVIHFRADQHLGFNITFQQIYFSAKEINICLFGMVRILMRQELRYCGSQSQMSIFSSQSAVDITFFVEPYTALYFDLKFSVTDNNIFQSYTPNPSLLSRTIPFSWVSFQWGIMRKWNKFRKTKQKIIMKEKRHWKDVLILKRWSVFHQKACVLEEAFLVKTAQVASLSFEVVLKEGFGLTVFGGPGTLSQILLSLVCVKQKCQTTATSSSFQVSVLYFSRARNFSGLQHIKFHSNMQSLSKWKTETIHSGKHRHFFFPNETLCNFEELCILHLTTDQQKYLNISIQEMSFNERSNINCSFAGVGFYDYPSFAEISVVCPQVRYIGNQREAIKDFVDMHKHRNVYSLQNSLIVAFYSFKKYGNFVVNLQAETTSCEVVVVNACNRTKPVDPSQESPCLGEIYIHSVVVSRKM